ncbi:MAG TPA: Type 1 glutamine amidotransferase-like domain-containing protein, partial [Candidatus Saccharibacteria bacterium]|nr:Type 1 glutamine amidotransferase-like domain-containing protein [Candidatus Saccharibacteria bacterium]
ALDQTGAEKPRVLLIPTACSTPGSYDKNVPTITAGFQQLGARVMTLHPQGELPSQEQIEDAIGSSDALYAIGGNSPHMLREMHKPLDERGHTLAAQIGAAILGGKTHIGTSAGALLPFESFLSNTRASGQAVPEDFQILEGLPILRGVATAHGNKYDMRPHLPDSPSRQEILQSYLDSLQAPGISIDEGAAVIFGREQGVITTGDSAVHALVASQPAVRVEDPGQLNVFLPRV